MKSPYKHYKMTDEQASALEDSWGKDAESNYCESSFGYVVWNKKTGEILWVSYEENSNGELLKKP